MDKLFYRFPQEEKAVKKSGEFQLLQDGKKPKGFLVSDFLHQQLYLFDEKSEGNFSQWHESAHKPVVISKRDYQIEAQGMLHAFPVFQVEKAVYSRVKQIPFSSDNAEMLFNILCEEYPKAFVYLISSSHFGTWIGATPELLLAQTGMKVETIALAGTQHVDERREWTKKEQQEHQFVTEHILETLARNGCVDVETEGPFSIDSGPVSHLKTSIQALLTQDNVWPIAMDLHPTPAVCGTPRMAALDLLLSREMHERKLYAGIIGEVQENKTHLFVNLRCAQLFKNQAYLYVGGGYTIDSIPDLEWDETENKAQTLEKFMKMLEH